MSPVLLCDQRPNGRICFEASASGLGYGCPVAGIEEIEGVIEMRCHVDTGKEQREP